ncbi:heparinase II/III family protein [Photobacterium sp. SP02]|uniref:heparinase II/III family protein n=1 Tax=Photobacterium sp. SP02 TaxID=3032280 RepID=UPI0031453264
MFRKIKNLFYRIKRITIVFLLDIYGILSSKFKKDFINNIDFNVNFDNIKYDLPDEFIRGIEERKLVLLGDEYLEFSSNGKDFNWSKCPNTGYIWKRKWHKLSNKDRKDDIDIKVPWELGRLQFLIPYLLNSKSKKNEDIVIKDINLILASFIKGNPPGLGVQWACNMDVSIRAVNLIFLYLLILDDNKTELKSDLSRLLKSEFPIYLNHIENHFEWNNGNRNNHYLCNLMGAVSLSAILYELSGEFKYNLKARKYAGLFMDEVCYQFNDDGSNFECSLNYHRLSTECFFTTLLFIFEYDLLSESDKSKILGMYSKALSFLKCFLADGILPNIGDTDSGIILMLKPQFMYRHAQMILDSRKLSQHLYDEISVFEGIKSYISKYIASLDYKPKIEKDRAVNLTAPCVIHQGKAKINIDTNNKCSDWICKYYKDFGIAKIYRDKDYILIKLNGKNNTGHKHLDFIKTEIFLKGMFYSKFPGNKWYKGTLAERFSDRVINKNIDFIHLPNRFEILPLDMSEYRDSLIVSDNYYQFKTGDLWLDITVSNEELLFDYNDDPFIFPDVIYPAYNLSQRVSIL